MDGYDILIDADGLRFVYDDELAALLELGTVTVERASFVEPVIDAPHSIDLGMPSETVRDFIYQRGPFAGWTADMRPSDGPVLGPFKTRQAALDAERCWLREEKGL